MVSALRSAPSGEDLVAKNSFNREFGGWQIREFSFCTTVSTSVPIIKIVFRYGHKRALGTLHSSLAPSVVCSMPDSPLLQVCNPCSFQKVMHGKHKVGPREPPVGSIAFTPSSSWQ